MLIKEFRIILPITVEEYNIGQLWSVAEASKNETGGGEGIEVVKNEPYDDEKGKGQYTKKVYHLASRVPKLVKLFAPKGALVFEEKAWNAYPYCKTVVTNPAFMGEDNFEISIESWYKPDLGESVNVHNLPKDDWKNVEVIYIDIANNENVSRSDYNSDYDPTKVTFDIGGRKALTPNWIEDLRAQAKAAENGGCDSKPRVPYMCAYKLVRCNFKWLGFQGKVEKYIQAQERRIFNNFNRQVFCWLDRWHNLNMEDIRRIENKTKEDLDEMIHKGSIKGTKVED